MSRYGLPDYGMYAALENMGNLVDYGELAARLGSIVAFNREGNIIFWDDFEKTPMKWTVDKGIGSETVGYNADTALSGGQCVMLKTVANVNSIARIIRNFPFYHTGRVGFEFAFNHEEKEAVLYFDIYHITDDRQYEARIRIDIEAQEMAYRASDGNYTVFAENVQVTKQQHLFHHFKVVIDTKKGEYIRVMFDRWEWNLEDIGLYNWAMVADEYIVLTISLLNTGSLAQTVYIDNVILTQNEP